MRTQNLAAGVGILIAACQAPPADDLVRLTVTTTQIDVDSFCSGGDCPTSEIDVDVFYEKGAWLPPSAAIEVAQYRVDYDLTGVAGTVPFFADTTALTVSAGQTGTLVAAVAGSAQRAFVYADEGGQEVSGTGTIRLACYDHKSDVFEVSTTFDIKFVNLADENGEQDSDDTGLE